MTRAFMHGSLYRAEGALADLELDLEITNLKDLLLGVHMSQV